MNKEARLSSKKKYRILLENCVEIKSLRRRNPALRMVRAYLVTLCEMLQRNRMMNSELEGMWQEAVLSSFQVPKHDSFE
jgi:hypothetical protein